MTAGKGKAATTTEIQIKQSTAQIQIIENAQLMIKERLAEGKIQSDALYKASGQVGLNKPFRAPIYKSTTEAFTGLYRQGVLGLYKGNGCRLYQYYFFGQVKNYANKKMDGNPRNFS